MKLSCLRSTLTVVSLVGSVGLSSSLTSCGLPHDEVSKINAITDLPRIDFSTWCSSFGLQRCDALPDNKVPVDQWQAGVDVFKELMDSLTSISLTRSDFDRSTVQDLFSTFGADSLLSFISKINWEKIVKEDSALVLENSTDNAVAIINGLQLIGTRRVVAKFAGPQLVSISGLSMADALGNKLAPVKYLDLSKPSRITIVTDTQRFVDIPIQFFQVADVKPPTTLTPTAVFKAIANVVLEPGFDWRHNLSVFFDGGNLNNIYNRVKGYIPAGAADQTTRQVVANTQVFMVGGATSNILLSMQMRSPLTCKAAVRNIPILGTINFDINFKAGFGLSDVKRINEDSVKTNVYGVTTSVGKVDYIEVDVNQLRMKVGAFTIPIDFSSLQPGTRGPTIENVECR